VDFDPEFPQPSGGELDQNTYKKHRAAAKAMAEDASNHHGLVCDKYRNAVASYSWHSKSLNHWLLHPSASERVNHPGALAKMADLHARLSKAVDEAPAAHADMHLYSGISGKHARTLLTRHKEGDVLRTKTWTSTSFMPEVAGKFAQTESPAKDQPNRARTILHIHVRKGQRGILHCESASLHAREEETLIKPGVRLRINKVYEPGGSDFDSFGERHRRRIISAEIVD
jgi:hypothetical protein